MSLANGDKYTLLDVVLPLESSTLRSKVLVSVNILKFFNYRRGIVTLNDEVFLDSLGEFPIVMVVVALVMMPELTLEVVELSFGTFKNMKRKNALIRRQL
jgi:hypothetical protein